MSSSTKKKPSREMLEIGRRIQEAWDAYQQTRPGVTRTAWEGEHGIIKGHTEKAIKGTDIQSTSMSKILAALNADANYILLGRVLKAKPPKDLYPTRSAAVAVIRSKPDHDPGILDALCEDYQKDGDKLSERDWIARYYELLGLSRVYDEYGQRDGSDGSGE